MYIICVYIPGVRCEDIFKARKDFDQSGTVAISIELHTNKQTLVLQIITLKKTTRVHRTSTTPVAQLVEHSPRLQSVVDSNPTRGQPFFCLSAVQTEKEFSPLT